MANTILPALKKAHQYIFGWGWYAVGYLGYRIINEQEGMLIVALVMMLTAFIAQRRTREFASIKLDIAGWVIAVVFVPLAIDPLSLGSIIDVIALIVLVDAVTELVGHRTPVGNASEEDATHEE